MMNVARNKEQGIEKKILGGVVSPPFTSYQLLATKSGFTLLELMIVIAVIGVLSSIFITQYPAVQRRARDAERMSDIKQYQTAMEAYANSNDGSFLAASGSLPGECGNLGLTNCPDDPQSSYKVYSTSSLYVLWATLEQEDSGNIQDFVVCSDGKSGQMTSGGSYTNCPL